MIVWLASYPRSGNALLRIILRNVFGITSYSLYSEGETGSAFHRIMGHVELRDRGPKALAAMKAESNSYFIKTHELPSDDGPAIYVIRDGRAATASYWRFRNEYFNESMSYAQFTAGRVLGGAWQNHVLAWAPDVRRNTLLVRYEMLVRADPQVIAALSSFLKRAPLRGPEILHKVMPLCFNVSSSSLHSSEIEDQCLELALEAEFPDVFWRQNGAAMMRMGYVKQDPEIFRRPV